MSKTLTKPTILVVAILIAVGGFFWVLSATATAQTSDEDTLKAENAALTAEFVKAFNTSDIDLLDTLFLQSDKTTWISLSQPFRVDGWTDVRSSVFAGLLSLPPGAVNLALRQSRIEILGDDAAVANGHFILTLRVPGAATRTINARFMSVREKIDGTWYYVSGHTSLLPE